MNKARVKAKGGRGQRVEASVREAVRRGCELVPHHVHFQQGLS